MSTKKLFIAKILIQIGIAIAANDVQHKETVSKNWHKTQVFIYYDYWRFMGDKLDCLGTILTRKFILTASTCILNSDLPLEDAIVYHNKENYDIEKYTVYPKFDKGAIVPDLAVLKLTKDIESKTLISLQKKFYMYPQDKPGTLNLNVKIVKFVLPTLFWALTFQIDSVTYL